MFRYLLELFLYSCHSGEPGIRVVYFTFYCCKFVSLHWQNEMILMKMMI